MSEKGTIEQQKVLWIIFSVALFVLVVVGIGVIWFLPGGQRAPQVATAKSPTNAKISFDPYEWAKSQNNAYPGLNEGPQPKDETGGNFTIIYGQNPQSGTAGTLPAAPAPEAGAAGAAGAASTAVTPQVQPRPAPAPQIAVKAAAPAPRPAISHPSTARTVRSVSITQHWIQAGSYESSFRAEEVKKLLDKKGLASLVTTHLVGGTTYFRVRVGPYLSEQEAQKFLGVVKEINGFQNSYISLVYTTRSAQ